MSLSRFVNNNQAGSTLSIGAGRGLSRMTSQFQSPTGRPDYTQRITNAQQRLMAVGQPLPEEPDETTILDRIFNVLNFLNNKKNQTLSYLSGDKEAFSREVSGADLLQQWGMGEGTGNQIAGFAFDMLTDPLNFLTFGAAGAATNVAKAGIKAAGAVDDLALGSRALASVGNQLPDLAKDIGRRMAGDAGEEAAKSADDQRRLVAKLGAFGKYWEVPGSDRVLSTLGSTVGGAAKGLGRFVEQHLPDLAEAGRDIRDTAGRLFQRGYGVPEEVTKITQRSQDLYRMDVRDVVNEVREIVGDWKDVDHLKVIEAVEDPTKLGNLNPKEAQAFQQVKDFFDFYFLKALEHGVINEFRANYIPHIFKGKQEEVAKGLEQIRRRGSRIPTNSPFAQQRTILMDLSQILKDPELSKKLKPETDLGKIMGIYKISLQKAIRNRDMIDELVHLGPDVIRQIGVDDVPDSWVKVPVAQLKGYAVPPDIARHLKDIIEPFVNSDSASKLFKLYDSLLGWWKGMATIPNPGFHFRNIFGSVFNNYLAGLRSLEPYRLALDAVRAPDYRLDEFYDLVRSSDNTDILPVLAGTNLDTPGVGITGGTTSFSRVFNNERFRELITGGDGPKIKVKVGDNSYELNMAGIKLLARMNGVTGRGMIGYDISDELDKVLRRLRGEKSFQDINPLSRESVLFRGLEDFGQTIEDHSRLAHFIDRLQKGDSVEEAAMSVKKYLFDYSQLTPFEKNVMKRFIPFYAWTRLNLPLQLAELVKQPKYATVMGKFQQFMSSLSDETTGTEMDKGDMPRYLRDLYAIRLPFQIGPEERDVMIGIDLPIRDVNTIRPSEWFSMLTPFLTVPFEQIANRNVYFNRDIESFEGQTVRAPGYVQGIFKAIQALDENAPESIQFNQIANALGFTVAYNEYGQPEIRVPARSAHILNQFVALKNMGKLADFAMGESFDPFGVSSMLTGVSAVSNTEVQRIQSDQYEQYQRLQDLLRKLRDEGRPVPTLDELEDMGMGTGLRRMRGGL